MLHKFINYLTELNLAANTVKAYSYAALYFVEHYPDISKTSLLNYKEYLIENFKPQTINVRIQGINRFLDFQNLPALKLKLVKTPTKNYLDNVISDEDYRYFKMRLKNAGLMEWYFMVWFLCATGARIGELLQLRIEDVLEGHFDIYTKGGKIRRLYVPGQLRHSAMEWLKEGGRTSGCVFLNRFGEPISPRGVAMRLKQLGRQFGIDPKVIYPHSFRHLFAKNFLARYNDLSLLADLMGHRNIETTRVYLRQSALEQRRLIDNVVNW